MQTKTTKIPFPGEFLFWRMQPESIAYVQFRYLDIKAVVVADRGH